MADLATEGFYLVDRTGRFLYVNAQGHAQMGGYSMEEMLSLTVCDISPDLTPEAFAAHVAASAQGPMPCIESRTRRKDGSIYPAEVSAARLEVDGEVYLFGVARDVTERKAAENERKRLAAQLLRTIEGERQRVARELHDDVGQALATVGILLDALELEAHGVPEAFRATRATIRRITESLARIVREYHPAELLGLGLADTLRTYVRQLAERHGLRWRFESEPVEGLLAPDQELQVYRVVQEALANAARHAGARRIEVAIAATPEHLAIRVRDDGGGFRVEAPVEGIGLATMRERATLLRAALLIDSAPRDGTTVELTIPLAPEPPDDGGDDGRTMRFLRSPVAPERPAALPPALDLEVFRQMADMASEAFELVDRHGRFVYVNDRACTITGYSRDELLERSVSEINPDFPPDVWNAWAAAAEGPVPSFATRNRRRDGQMIPVEVSATPITVHGVRYFFAVVRDLTDRREAEAAARGFTRRLLHTLEAERRRVARELHDEVGHAIATVGVLLHALESEPGAVVGPHPEIAATHATIRSITESVARIVRDYHPAELLALGLEEALRTHARLFTQRHGLALRLSTAAVEDQLSDEQALHLYRIVQEALANVARHGSAHRVAVRLVRHGARITATVRDDGVGFDPEASRIGGLGLVTMRERAALIGGALAIRSRPGQGTEIRVTLHAGAAARDADD